MIDWANLYRSLMNREFGPWKPWDIGRLTATELYLLTLGFPDDKQPPPGSQTLPGGGTAELYRRRQELTELEKTEREERKWGLL